MRLHWSNKIISKLLNMKLDDTKKAEKFECFASLQIGFWLLKTRYTASVYMFCYTEVTSYTDNLSKEQVIESLEQILLKRKAKLEN